MRLLLQRTQSNVTRTLGILSIDDLFECFTLEDPRQEGPKVPGKTRIPSGLYRIVVTLSPRFGVPMPLLLDVPGFEGIRIHAGNTADDTAGCILVGERLGRGGLSITASKRAYERVFDQLVRARNRGEEVWIAVVDEPSREGPGDA